MGGYILILRTFQTQQIRCKKIRITATKNKQEKYRQKRTHLVVGYAILVQVEPSAWLYCSPMAACSTKITAKISAFRSRRKQSENALYPHSAPIGQQLQGNMTSTHSIHTVQYSNPTVCRAASQAQLPKFWRNCQKLSV